MYYSEIHRNDLFLITSVSDSTFEVMMTVRISWRMTPRGLVNNYRQCLSAARLGVIFNNLEVEGIKVFRNLGNY